jgi:hypothetical protein
MRHERSAEGSLPVAVMGPRVPRPGEEHLFRREQRGDARAWAMAGGVAIYRRRNDDAALQVLGRLHLLLAWASENCLETVLAPPRGLPPSFFIEGELASQILARTEAPPSEADRQVVEHLL